ncbi:hypothetical protein PR048_020270 [Dryococelus australis]|uniref:Uncharacterized protein n=1 Tax=Dryococelus australis TaxID=614101 RepID=A0ABQ9H5U1_9NEOP|nr:hypothetical protein PR048_020270 [Dryococelus australis]
MALNECCRQYGTPKPSPEHHLGYKTVTGEYGAAPELKGDGKGRSQRKPASIVWHDSHMQKNGSARHGIVPGGSTAYYYRLPPTKGLHLRIAPRRRKYGGYYGLPAGLKQGASGKAGGANELLGWLGGELYGYGCQQTSDAQSTTSRLASQKEDAPRDARQVRTAEYMRWYRERSKCKEVFSIENRALEEWSQEERSVMVGISAWYKSGVELVEKDMGIASQSLVNGRPGFSSVLVVISVCAVDLVCLAQVLNVCADKTGTIWAPVKDRNTVLRDCCIADLFADKDICAITVVLNDIVARFVLWWGAYTWLPAAECDKYLVDPELMRSGNLINVWESEGFVRQAKIDAYIPVSPETIVLSSLHTKATRVQFPAGLLAGFTHVVIVLDNVTSKRVYSEISRGFLLVFPVPIPGYRMSNPSLRCENTTRKLKLLGIPAADKIALLTGAGCPTASPAKSMDERQSPHSPHKITVWNDSRPPVPGPGIEPETPAVRGQRLNH